MLEIIARRDGREVEGGGLENRCPVMSGTGGSNPSPSASFSKQQTAGGRQGAVLDTKILEPIPPISQETRGFS